MATGPEVFRPADHGDCQAVMAIDRNVYGGLDYLEAKFHAYLAEPLMFPFIAEFNGEVVAYKCGYIIDDGLSIVSQSARVRADLRGKGIMRKLDEATLKAASVKFPKLQRALWTSTNLEMTTNTVKKRKGEVQLLAQRPRVSFDKNGHDLHAICQGAHFQRLLTRFGASDITAIPHRLAIEVLAAAVDLRAAVPEGILIVNFQPWGLFRSTYVELLKGSTLHLMEDVKEEVGEGNLEHGGRRIYTERTVKGAGRVQCFSFHSVLQTNGGSHRCRVDFYCPPGEQATAKAAAHLLYHIRELATCYLDGEVSFSFLIPQHIDKPMLKRILTEELQFNCGITPESDGLVCSWKLGNPSPKL